MVVDNILDLGIVAIYITPVFLLCHQTYRRESNSVRINQSEHLESRSDKNGRP